MTTLYNGQLYLQGLNDVVPGITGVTSADTILSVLNNIQTNIASSVMMEIGSYNQNVANGTPIYKYLMGFSNSASGLGGYYTMDGITKSSSVRFLTMFQSGGNVQVGINTASPLYTFDVNGSIHAATTMQVDGKTTLNNTIQFKTDIWNTSSDSYNRIYFETNSTTYFGSRNGYYFQNAASSLNIVTIDNSGTITTLGNLFVSGTTTLSNTLVVGAATTLSNTLAVSGATTLSNTLSITGATTATGLITADGGLQVNGTATATGLITGGAGLSITGAITLSGNVTSSNGIFYGNGSGLTDVSADLAKYANSAGSAPANVYSPIVLYNMNKASASGSLTDAGYTLKNFCASVFGGITYSYYECGETYHPPNFVPAISVFSDSGNKYIFVVAQGSGAVGSLANSYGGISDSNLKENVVTARDYTEDICKLRVVTYNFINDPSYTPFISTFSKQTELFDLSGNIIGTSTIQFTVSSSKKKNIGLIAQEVQTIFPGLVESIHITDKDTDIVTSTLSVKTSLLIPMLVTSVQSLNRRLDEYENVINKLMKLYKVDSSEV